MTDALLAKALLEAAEQKQRGAADPAVSAWVRANAGTGKTHVLVQRILRLFLSGADPRSILCLTFTKNAAAEMEARVLAKLGEWATAGNEALTGHLSKLLARAPSEAELAVARCLFATVIDAPGGLAIMTIHSFCERILRRYSFEANVPPGFAVLTEEEARDALSEAMAQAFASAASGPLRDALTAVVAYAGETDFARVLQAMLGHRNAITHLLRVTDADDPVLQVAARTRRVFQLAPGDTRESLVGRSASVLDAHTLKEAVRALSEGTKTDLEAMARFQAAARAQDAEQKCAALKAAFTTRGGEARKSLMTAAIRKQAPALHDRLVEAQAAFIALDEGICGLKVVEATIALLRLTAAIFERYEAGKRARAAVDFDDLIGKTLSLFSRGDAADWVLYQLDGRIDHILVDEAQDTSPEQWAILEKLTSDFFSGEGARECVPTLFAVGDEKQSIYGFQGAAPELLAHYGASYEKKANDAGFRWRTVDLDLSFRTLAPVLAAVDCVTGALPGLHHGASVPHIAFRRDHGGVVELWEPERGEKQDKGSVWDPEPACAPDISPAEALAARIAAQIRHWLEGEEGLASQGRPIEPGDILILLRKREPMARLLQAALKREGIPVSGADRVALLDEIAVMDLLALASVVLQPEDDLALAEVLKSPLFGFCDEDLFELAFGREASLWEGLESAASGPGTGKYADAAAKLAAWRALAHRVSPLEFFAQILQAEGGRKAFAARLGVECFDAIGELLNLAEAFGARAQASLSEFLVFVRQGASEVKRETDQAAREVRIMTVHGAKGLEANIVILADACSNRSASGAPVYFVDDETGGPPMPVWAIKGASGLPPIAAVKDDLNGAERRELGRLLYVAMTRARDRLCIAGFHKGELPAGCWYETIKSALSPKLQPAADFQGRPIWRHGSVASFPLYALPAQKAAGKELPQWLAAPAPMEPASPILTPSRLLSGRDVEHAREGTSGFSRKQAQAKGIMVHRLLEVLPALAAHDRQAAANAIASAYKGEVSAGQAEAAIESVLALISCKVFADDAGRSLAEAGVAVTLHDLDGKCRGIIIGQADHISVGPSEINIFDYKSGTFYADPGLSSEFNAQLAAYRLALMRLYPASNVHAALINTGTMVAAHAEDAVLDAFLASLTGTLRN